MKKIRHNKYRYLQTIKPRFRITTQGMAVISGIPYQYMRHILTLAALQWYDSNNRTSDLDSRGWNKNVRWMLDQLEKSCSEAIDGTHARRDRSEKPLKDRLKARNKERQTIKGLINEALRRRRDHQAG